MIKKILQWWRTPAVTLSLYQEAILRFQRPQSIDDAVYVDLSQIEVLLPTIDRYLEVISLAICALEDNLLFQPSSQALATGMTRRKYFYLGKEGNYLDVAAVHHAFISSAIQLLDLYERKTAETGQSGLLQSNLFRILPVINNLFTLSRTLVEEP